VAEVTASNTLQSAGLHETIEALGNSKVLNPNRSRRADIMATEQFESAKEQFVNDYTIVVDNDQQAYNHVRDLVQSTEGNPEQWEIVKESLQDQFEKFVERVADMADEEGIEVGANLLRQMLFGYGDAWYSIARHYIESVKEEN
jgi:hypothetical protein